MVRGVSESGLGLELELESEVDLEVDVRGGLRLRVMDSNGNVSGLGLPALVALVLLSPEEMQLTAKHVSAGSEIWEDVQKIQYQGLHVTATL